MARSWLRRIKPLRSRSMLNWPNRLRLRPQRRSLKAKSLKSPKKSRDLNLMKRASEMNLTLLTQRSASL